MVLNLTNPQSHYEVTKHFLQYDKHVYSEKPLAQNFDDTKELVALAEARNLLLGSAPCNHLAEAAQAVQRALASNVIGTPKLAYPEMDDGFVALSPYRNWANVSGALGLTKTNSRLAALLNMPDIISPDFSFVSVL
jgi:predicted dehydrogenase